jgi:hypothetical protein
MSFALSQFRSLIEKYPTWESLSTFLQSEEGGKLRIIYFNNTDTNAIIRYVKGVSDMSKEHVRLFRSVVWHAETNRPICVAPIKAEPTKLSPPGGEDYWVSEFIDGVMINVFRHGDRPAKIATRTNFGAHNTFYSEKSFARLFEEATPKDIDWNTLLQPNQFVSFVLQHPEHTSVSSVRHPRIFATQFGSVEANGNVNIHISPVNWPTALRGFAPFHYSNFCFEGPAVFRSYKFKGYVIQSTNSYHRYRIVNPDYNTTRDLLGSESTKVLRFLRLRKEGHIKNYLQYFKEQSKEMWDLEQTFRQKTHDVYQAYCDVNKAKTKTMKDIPIPFRTPVYKLQGQYLASLPKPGEKLGQGQVSAFGEGEDKQPVPIRKDMVVAYVNGLTVEEQAGILEAEE